MVKDPTTPEMEKETIGKLLMQMPKNAWNQFRLFLGMIAGCDTHILKMCKSAEISKKAVIGTAMICVVIFAFIMCYITMIDVFGFGVATALIFSIFWAFLVLGFDRAAIKTIESPATSSKKDILNSLKSLPAIWRFVMVLLIAHIISISVEMKFFQSKINESLKTERMNAIEEKYKASQAEIASNNADVKSLGDKHALLLAKREDRITEAKVAYENALATAEKARAEATAEADGSGGSKVRGINGITNLKILKAAQDQIAADSLLVLYQKAQKDTSVEVKASALILAKRNRQIDSTNTAINQKFVADKADIMDSKKDWGFWARYEKLHDIELSSFGAFFFALMLWFLFIVIETFPVMIKIFTPAGEYEKLVVMQAKLAIDTNLVVKIEEAEHEKLDALIESREEKKAKISALYDADQDIAEAHIRGSKKVYETYTNEIDSLDSSPAGKAMKASLIKKAEQFFSSN